VLVSDDTHLTHNFDLLPAKMHGLDMEFILLGGKEGIRIRFILPTEAVPVQKTVLFDHSGNPDLKGVGEIRHGMFPHEEQVQASSIVTIEPMHGNQMAIYRHRNPGIIDAWTRTVLDSTLDDGHALACGDLLGAGSDQIVVGWRAMAHPEAKVGIKLFAPDEKAEKWSQHVIDDNTMACEDLILADLDGDKKLEIIASGRRTKNVKVYWNETR
jgi:hypothetical protein